MDGSAFRDFPAGALFWWALVGIAAATLIGIASVIGAAWWLWHHVVIV